MGLSWVGFALFLGLITLEVLHERKGLNTVSNINEFRLYKDKPLLKESTKLKMKGCYLLSNPNLFSPYISRCIFLYTDGTIYASLFLDISQDTCYSIIKHKIQFAGYRYEGWGCYRIKNDSIYVQDLSMNGGEFAEVVNFKGLITSDSTFLLVDKSTVYGSTTGKSSSTPMMYSFQSLKHKPDSSIAWYKHKKWYKKWLNEKNKNPDSTAKPQ